MANWIRKCMEALAPDVTPQMLGRRCLILAPHPDDEVLGCGGTITTKVRMGDGVFVAYLTNGRKGVPSTDKEAVALREDEARQANHILGLPADHLTFLRFEDGNLAEYVHQATATIRKLVAMLRIDDILVPYRKEYHPDHLAAWKIGKACLQEHMRAYEYPVWYGPWLWSRLGWRSRLAATSHLADWTHVVKISISNVTAIKQQALAAYRSQISAFTTQGEWGQRFLANFTGEYEIFFVSQ